MEGARLQLRRTTPAALLSLTLLIPGAFALQCHSYSLVSGDPTNNAFGVHRVSGTCFASQNACVEAHLLLTTGETMMFASHRGCAREGLKDEGRSSAGNQHLTIQSHVRYCHTDLCNKDLDLTAFKIPKQDNASEASSSNQCFSGFTTYLSQDLLGRVTCRKNSSQCYQGKGTITVGHSKVGFLIKTCQDSSCNVLKSHSFGPIKLMLRGSCCHGTFCNGKAVAPHILASNLAATQIATRPHEEDTTAQPTVFPKHDVVNDTEDTSEKKEDTITLSTDFPKHDIVNDTQDSSEGPEEDPSKYDYESDINTPTTTQNPWYDEEENEDGKLLSVHTNNTLNPRAANLGPPKPSLPFYLLLAALGIGSLKIW